jgi:hypothetical protein
MKVGDNVVSFSESFDGSVLGYEGVIQNIDTFITVQEAHRTKDYLPKQVFLATDVYPLYIVDFDKCEINRIYTHMKAEESYVQLANGEIYYDNCPYNVYFSLAEAKSMLYSIRPSAPSIDMSVEKELKCKSFIHTLNKQFRKL